MAEVYRPTYTYTDRATGKKIKRRSKRWHVRYYTPDGERHRVKGYADKRATESLAAELEKRGQRVDGGFADALDEHATRPLVEHVDDFRRYLAAKGNTSEYVAKMLFRLTAALDVCRFHKIADIQSSAVVEFLGALRREGKSVKTANDYLATVKGFTRWLWRDKRCVLDGLAGLSKLANGETDLRHARRDFSPEELARLLDGARQSPKTVRCLPGIDRHFLYLTACATGFRVSELASMTPGSFALDVDTPTAKVQATCTKNRKEAVQPLPLDVAQALRDYLRGKPVAAPVWPDNPKAPAESWRLHAAEMIRHDLCEAREKWLRTFQDARQQAEAEQTDFLGYRDADGRCADFHALRHTFITMVGKAGVSPREHQDLARHSTYALTSRYSHSRFYDLAAAVQALPIPTAGPDLESQTLSATGTDGNACEKLGPNLGPQSENSRDFARQSGTEQTRGKKQKTPENMPFLAFSEAFAMDGANYPQGDSNPCLRRERAMS
jgi:integrase/recombinase XerD